MGLSIIARSDFVTRVFTCRRQRQLDPWSYKKATPVVPKIPPILSLFFPSEQLFVECMRRSSIKEVTVSFTVSSRPIALHRLSFVCPSVWPPMELRYDHPLS